MRIKKYKICIKETYMSIRPKLEKQTVALSKMYYKLYYKDSVRETTNMREEAPHIHDCYELYFHLSGDVNFLVNNRLYEVKRGDWILTRPGDMHLCIYRSACKHEHYCMWVSTEEGSEVHQHLERLVEVHHVASGEDTTRAEQIFSSLLHPDGTPFCTEIALLSLLSLPADQPRRHGSGAPCMPEALRAVVDDICENVHEIRSVEEIAGRHYISRATLCRWFRQYLHLSPRDFLEAQRLSCAKRILSAGGSVTDACMGAGFSDCSYFIAVFKRRFGITPLQFQRHLTFLS